MDEVRPCRCFLGIGIDEYSEDSLQNAVRSALCIGGAFQKLGYHVTHGSNIRSRVDWNEKVKELTENVDCTTSVVAFYFAGHGVVTKDKTLRLLFGDSSHGIVKQSDQGSTASNDDVSISMDDLIKQLMHLPMADDAFLLVLLDNCRTETSTSWHENCGRPAQHMFSRSFTVIYATAPGKWALDGNGSQISPLSYSLQRRMSESQSLAATYNLIVNDVKSYTKNLRHMSQIVQTFTCGKSDEGVFQPIPGPGMSMSSSTVLPLGSDEASVDSTTLQPPTKRWCCKVLTAFTLLILAIFLGVCLLMSSLQPRDCILNEWTDDGPCSKSCGGGLVIQRRSVKTSAAHGADLSSPERQRQVPCAVLACPWDCCFDDYCPVQCDLRCSSWTCEALVNMTVCSFGWGYSSITADATIVGRPVTWTVFNYAVHRSGISLHDHGFDKTFVHRLNFSFESPTHVAFCRCLGDYARSILNKRMMTNCEAALLSPVARPQFLRLTAGKKVPGFESNEVFFGKSPYSPHNWRPTAADSDSSEEFEPHSKIHRRLASKSAASDVDVSDRETVTSTDSLELKTPKGPYHPPHLPDAFHPKTPAATPAALFEAKVALQAFRVWAFRVRVQGLGL
ncbi:unnamed protein product [Symbiodinium sp. KB8]|nr:unnamed protein product [Symbiodinium sp. KB8]